MSYVSCSSNNLILYGCSHNSGYSYGCSHSDDAGARCYGMYSAHNVYVKKLINYYNRKNY